MFRFALRSNSLLRLLSLLMVVSCSLLPQTSRAANPLAAPVLAGGRPPESGTASWHDPAGSASSRRTASRYPWSGNELVGAHKTLPLGTRVRVFNLSNGRQVVVVITDRGPYRRGRIIDVSRSAAQQLDLIKAGTAHVRLETLKPGES